MSFVWHTFLPDKCLLVAACHSVNSCGAWTLSPHSPQAPAPRLTPHPTVLGPKTVNQHGHTTSSIEKGMFCLPDTPRTVVSGNLGRKPAHKLLSLALGEEKGSFSFAYCKQKIRNTACQMQKRDNKCRWCGRLSSMVGIHCQLWNNSDAIPEVAAGRWDKEGHKHMTSSHSHLSPEHLRWKQSWDEVCFVQQLVVSRLLWIFKTQKGLRSIVFHLLKNHISLSIYIGVYVQCFQYSRDFFTA